jgi:diguanylate cyclase (GGDEF)-like protein
MDEITISSLKAKLAVAMEALQHAEVQSAGPHTDLEKMHQLEMENAALQGQLKEIRLTHAVVEQSRDRYLDLYEFAPVGYLTLSSRTITQINWTGARLLAMERNQILGSRISQFVSPEDRPRLARLLRQVGGHGIRRSIDLELSCGDNVSFPAQLDCMRMQTDPPSTVRVTLTDVTERKKAEAEIRQLAYFDPLTGLSNRRLLLEQLAKAIGTCGRTRQHAAVLFIDMDDFKSLNDGFGHSVGDLLLREVARRLMNRVPVDSTVGRLGGDEFVVILEGLGEDEIVASEKATALGEGIIRVLGDRYLLAGTEYRMTGCMGIALFNSDEVPTHDLLTHADIALYSAKGVGRSIIRTFNPEMQEATIAKGVLDRDLRRALREGQFVLYYQPQVDVRGHLTGVEALLRWQHPKRGLLLPSSFLQFAEEIGLIDSIGQWVLRSACAALRKWSRIAGLQDLTLALNVSAYEFRHPDFATRMLDIIEDCGADPAKFMLEFTEGLMFSTIEDTMSKMEVLRARGVRFSLDDFGIGYSSFAYLQSLPLDQLKIDQTFVRNMIINQNDAVIVRSMIALGRSLGLEVIAEGVEREDQRAVLVAQGCDGYQGFLFGRAVTENDLLLLAEDGARRHIQ